MSVLLPSLVLMAALPGQAARTAVKYHPLPKHDAFVKNWDESAPVFAAVIRSSDEWHAVYGTAATMSSERGYGPDPASFKKEAVLVVCRVGASTSKYKVTSLTESGGTLTLKYAFTPGKKESAEFKVPLALVVPNRPWKKVVFIEGGRQVASLNLAAGEFKNVGD